MTTLTKEQRDTYLAHGGQYCPVCGSSELDTGAFRADENYAWRSVGCENCGASWEDVYTLTFIAPTED